MPRDVPAWLVLATLAIQVAAIAINAVVVLWPARRVEGARPAH